MKEPINVLAVLMLVSFTSGTFTLLSDWLLVKSNDGDIITRIFGTNGNTLNVYGSDDLNSFITCNSASMNSASSSLGILFTPSITSLTEFTVGVWANFKSTISPEVFLFGSSSSKHYLFSSVTNGAIKVSYYKDASTTDPNNDFFITVPLSNFHIDKWFFIAFDFVNNGGTITFNILVSGVAKYSKTSVEDSPVPFQMPIVGFYFGKSVTAKFYEVLITKSCSISGDLKTITLIDGADSLNIATRCGSTCGDASCLSSGDCLALKQFCTSCTSGSCNTCDPDSGRESSGYCQYCKYGTKIQGGNCDFYLGCANDNNCVGCSKSSTVCDACPAGNFLFKQSETFTSSCTDSCDQCLPGPSCFECADSIVQDGSTCRVDNIGYQISFDTPNIVIDFANPLSAGLTKNSFTATANDQTDIPITTWTFTGCTAGSIQCTIVAPNILESQLPVSLDIEFAKA